MRQIAPLVLLMTVALARGAPAVAIRAGTMRGELFLYVVHGEVELLIDNRSQRVVAEGLIVVPDSLHGATIKAAAGSGAQVVELIRKG